jgi:hypothetical protein
MSVGCSGLGQPHQRAQGFIHRLVIRENFGDVGFQMNEIRTCAILSNIFTPHSAFEFMEIIFGPETIFSTFVLHNIPSLFVSPFERL